jgi:hypothetical protein
MLKHDERYLVPQKLKKASAIIYFGCFMKMPDHVPEPRYMLQTSFCPF